jgi:hypothetical protein
MLSISASICSMERAARFQFPPERLERRIMKGFDDTTIILLATMTFGLVAASTTPFLSPLWSRRPGNASVAA